MRKQIAAANWKMNLTLEQGIDLAEKILSEKINVPARNEAIFAVPFPYLSAIRAKLSGSGGFFVSAQNVAAAKNGAYTGEVSASMLSSLGIPYVIIGHSERREYYGETDDILAKKIDLALAENCKPIFCCGESLSIREANNQNMYVADQLRAGLFHLPAESIKGFIIAYEPVWAIGTGKTASSDQAQEMHAHIRASIAEKYGEEAAASVSILYGGSVKASNASEIFSKPDVDGGLVGGASLVAKDFAAIIRSLKN